MKRIQRLLHREELATADLSAQVRALSHPLQEPEDLDPLLRRIGEARYVLLGEASHGTADYYTWRTALSKRLIRDKGFSFIAVEGDWPDCYQVNLHVKGQSDSGESARDVLQVFERWPTWMWANEEVVALMEFLRQHNEQQPEHRRVGFYGLDVYSLWDSLYAILSYLQRVDPGALPAAWHALRCFEPHGEDVQEYARATQFVPHSCEDEVVELLRQVRDKSAVYRASGAEAYFHAEQNAWVLQNAEAYYRAMVRGGPVAWNIRDQHMTETLERLMRHHGAAAKAIVWEHNTHIGDARYTDMAEEGMANVGQLVREGHADDEVFLIGFGSYSGSVIAGRHWEAPLEWMCVPSAREGSWEHVLHKAGAENKLLLWSAVSHSRELLRPRGHRAIGVVYRPAHEQYGNYVPTVLPRRYDAFLYLDETKALHPLHVPVREVGEVPETFPSGV